LQSNPSSTGGNAALSSSHNDGDYPTAEVTRQPLQKESTQLIEVEVIALTVVVLLGWNWHFTFFVLWDFVLWTFVAKQKES